MAVADSFDLWAASLCWGDEAFPAPVVVTNGRPASKASSAGSAAVTEEPAASFSGSPGSTVAAPQAEVDAAEGGMRFGPVLGKSEEVVRVADSEPVAPDDVPGMLSTQDILDHEELPGGLGAEDVEPEPLPESCLAPSPRPPMGGDEPTLQYEAHQVLPRDPGTAKVGVPQESSAPRMPRTLTGASELTLQYEAWQAGDDATQLYEAVARPAAPAAPMRAQGLKGDAGSSNTIGLPAEARQTETLLYEAPDCRPSFGDVLRSYGEELQTLPYAVWEPEAQDGTGEASIVTPACESTLEYAPWGGPVAGLPEARSQRVPQASSDAYVTPEKVSRSRGKTAQGTSGTRSGRQLAKVSATPSVLPGSGAEASRWLVPVKRRRREEEATPLQFSKITRPARPQVSNSAARPASRASILPAASMPSASVDGSQNSQGSSDARRQLTLAEAWRGVKRKVSCQEILDDSP
eukprot:TRINITY_DN9968_c0_g1_i3.p1 TRINITY_DN9968_c0_g1~~TRINITY_DN9968_c0_g1_i3.p1  ORF type:complete len:463 (+),score=94.08 TRINITY_DN9968_c0_g1_i3:82-1470(+)